MRSEDNVLSRRRWLAQLGMAAAALPVAKLLGCGDGDGDDAGGPVSEADAGTTRDDAATEDGSSAASGSWSLVGGTAAMLDKASYPNPFTALGATSCALICETTIGPCHTTSPERSDVSDGNDGLPMRISLRVVDENCQPVERAIVEIWHTNYKGIYSGRINEMCNKDEADRALGYFRGYQISDADGRVDFDSCFPGWYSGRAVHVHVRVLTGTYDASDSASATVITQLLWSDALIDTMFSEHPLYSPFGQPDTLLGTDNVVSGATDQAPYVFDVAKMSDGAMQASKTLVVRSDENAELCTLGSMGGAGGGMMGGPPPGT